MHINTARQHCDVIGIGIGPFNLSVAALLAPQTGIASQFFDTRTEFNWHPGLLFPEGQMQVSFLKDLTTTIDPTNPYTFLNFLARSQRIYRFLNAEFPRITRWEYNQYLRWVCSQMPNLFWRHKVHEVALHGNQFAVYVNDKKFYCNALVMGSGMTPFIPDCAVACPHPQIIHASQYLTNPDLKTAGRRVAVIGGGQTGAEIFRNLIHKNDAERPSELLWITRRSNFLPLDETAFTNEHFTPDYSDLFFNLPDQAKSQLLAQQKLASDGILHDLLSDIYRRLYELRYRDGVPRFTRLLPHCEMTELKRDGEALRFTVENSLSESRTTCEVDTIILCTGFEFQVPDYLAPIKDQLHIKDDQLVIDEQYGLRWIEPNGKPRIYLQNGARGTRGIADPNLSLMPWRSARIINDIAGREVYDTSYAEPMVDWHPEAIAAVDMPEEVWF